MPRHSPNPHLWQQFPLAYHCSIQENYSWHFYLTVPECTAFFHELYRGVGWYCNTSSDMNMGHQCRILCDSEINFTLSLPFPDPVSLMVWPYYFYYTNNLCLVIYLFWLWVKQQTWEKVYVIIFLGLLMPRLQGVVRTLMAKNWQKSLIRKFNTR